MTKNKVVAVVVLAVLSAGCIFTIGCAPRVTHRVATTPLVPPGEFRRFDDAAGKPILYISHNGTRWEWYGPAEDAVLAVLQSATEMNSLAQQLQGRLAQVSKELAETKALIPPPAKPKAAKP